MENNFARNLKFLRLQSGMTQAELAKKLDKDYSTIGKWELGQRSPIMADVITISELFDVPLEKLICSNDLFNPKSNPKEQIKQLSTNTGVDIKFAADKKLTAEDVLLVQQLLMDELKEQNK